MTELTKSGQNRWLVLAIIWVIFAVHGTDRSILLVLLEPIRKEFGLDDSQIGLLVGLGYAVPFALAGIPFGALVDRVPKRKYLLAVLVAVWSALTALGGFATGFVMLLLTRSCVGACEAGAPPTMMSILSDTFDPGMRPAALSVYLTAPFVGLMAGAIFAGHISQAYGWRVAVIAIGAPGILAAIAAAVFLREPIRGRFDALPADGRVAETAKVGAALLYAVREPNLRRLLIALVLGGFVTLAISNWAPVLLERILGFSQARTGGLTALVIGLPSVAGSLTGGALMARFGKGNSQTLLRFCGLVLLISVPMAVMAPLCQSHEATLILLAGWSFMASTYLGSGWSVFVTAIPAPMRGTILGFGVVMANFIGAGFGPQSVGLISDFLRRAQDAGHLQHAVAAIALVNLISAGLFFVSGRRRSVPAAFVSKRFDTV
jgi:predicted MFS family arabinose efflux permease